VQTDEKLTLNMAESKEMELFLIVAILVDARGKLKRLYRIGSSTSDRITYFRVHDLKSSDDALICRPPPVPFVGPRMPPKSTPRNTPSPSKKRKTDSTPVKRGVDYFFKKQVEKSQQPPSPEQPALFVDSHREDQRRKQEEEDERLARQLQDMEGRMEVARRLTKDYEAADKESNGGKEEPTVQEERSLPEPKETDIDSKVLPKTKLASDNSASMTPLEDIYAIPLDKDPLQFNPATDASCAQSWSPGKTPYAFLTHSFILINSTRSRLKIVDYLVNTLRVVIHHDPQSLLPLVWLTTNSIAPPFEGIELNIGGSVISKALMNTSGLTGGKLKGLYAKYGDIGDVAFEAKMSVRTLITPMRLTVTGVYSTLRNIARAQGKGSAETKRQLVERLLVSAKGEEVRYIGRTLVQNVYS
jgi:DNA ligase 1